MNIWEGLSDVSKYLLITGTLGAGIGLCANSAKDDLQDEEVRCKVIYPDRVLKGMLYTPIAVAAFFEVLKVVTYYGS